MGICGSRVFEESRNQQSQIFIDTSSNFLDFYARKVLNMEAYTLTVQRWTITTHITYIVVWIVTDIPRPGKPYDYIVMGVHKDYKAMMHGGGAGFFRGAYHHK